MNIKPLLFASAVSLLASSAWAQSTGKPLNLKLPNNLPASSSSAATPASSATAASTPAPTSVHPDGVASNGRGTAANSAPNTPPPISTTPGVYYGDTSGHVGDDGTAAANAQGCDDSKFDKAQVHDELSTGIASGSHSGTSSYEGGTVNVTKAFGDCDHPSGSIGISISVDQTHFNGGRYGNYRGY